MARSAYVDLEPFACHGCGDVLGYTSPGEAKRMNVRAHVFCENCKDAPGALTDRMQELLAALTTMRDAGERPTLAAAADALGVSKSRVQQIATAIRARGAGDELNKALGKDTSTAAA